MDSARAPEGTAVGDVVLAKVPWNDWYQWRTLFMLYVVDADNDLTRVGHVKIADVTFEKYTNDEEFRTPLQETFSRLGKSYASLGQDQSYYETLLAELGTKRTGAVLRSLRDLAYTPDRIDDLLEHSVIHDSLFREVGVETAKTQFHGIAHGGSELVPYEFTFIQPPEVNRDQTIRLPFSVKPESEPPTNVHVLIGRNGSGKTRLLNSMARELLGTENVDIPRGKFDTPDVDGPGFKNLVFVSFSAFDQSDLPQEGDGPFDVGFSRIGIQEAEGTLGPEELAKAFAASAYRIFQRGLNSLWKDALRTLESDKNFRDAAIADLIEEQLALAPDARPRTQVRQTFSRLSSGHKIVLLTITRLVESVVSRSLVLLDEPEAHLHPPLLSAFMRALSSLMQERNGVAIAATHSPVLLQEVPRSCALVIRRSGGTNKVDRPARETFGENVGVLTHDVFKLEVTRSGFYKLLEEAADEAESYEDVVRRFNNQLGGEARAILRSWFAARGNQ
ncbi:ATP-dependent nuclease [Microbacterium binotii]|uniref:ATP-dependent nuclease n=1 Tax=Microbacterium binotii TaxID=462710 RepID=UPI001F2753DF|nr:AAA family ATPase [Microbacterium binotii]UIN31302.1 AAA family ATPase [Microbacterium binotii]